MAPESITWEDLCLLEEEFDRETGEFCNTAFGLYDEEDNAYFGTLDRRRDEITIEEISSALAPVPDEDIFPEWTEWHEDEIAKVSDSFPSSGYYVKRPSLATYGLFREFGCVSLISEGFMDEVNALQKIINNYHPRLIYCWGCRVRRGRITGLVFEHHPYTLTSYLREHPESMKKDVFMKELKSAVLHLHSLFLAHNDINPGNILVDGIGLPVLIDFGATRRIGTKLGTSRGTKGWMDSEIEDYDTSDPLHDLFALEKIRTWLDDRTADNEG